MNAIKTTLILMLCLLGTLALAQAVKTKPELRLESYRVVFEIVGGKTTESFAKADSVKPGDTVEYRVKASNPTATGLPNFVIDLPIPSSTTYLENSATNAASIAILLASYDRKKSFATPPLKRKVIKDGKTVEETVKPNEYTDLRWIVRGELKAGQTLEFKARVKVK
jgi:uncharacterized repeat protein (TIGR01451 family)